MFRSAHPPGRRGFLRALAAFAAGGGSLGARLLRGQAAPQASSLPWDLSWRRRLTGEFRAVFDSPGMADGASFWRAASWREQVAEAYGVSHDAIHPIVVVRHRAIPMVMDDEFWTRHDLATKNKVTDPETGKAPQGNPFHIIADGVQVPPIVRAASIHEFLKSGGIVLACNLAFGMMVQQERAENTAMPRAEARARALAHLIPGVILQPSGYFGVLEAQRAGCALFPQDQA